MELSIVVAENSSLPMQKPKRNKHEHCRFEKSTPKIKGKQSLVINSNVVKVPNRFKRNNHQY